MSKSVLISKNISCIRENIISNFLSRFPARLGYRLGESRKEQYQMTSRASENVTKKNKPREVIFSKKMAHCRLESFPSLSHWSDVPSVRAFARSKKSDQSTPGLNKLIFIFHTRPMFNSLKRTPYLIRYGRKAPQNSASFGLELILLTFRENCNASKQRFDWNKKISTSCPKVLASLLLALGKQDLRRWIKSKNASADRKGLNRISCKKTTAGSMPVFG